MDTTRLRPIVVDYVELLLFTLFPAVAPFVFLGLLVGVDVRSFDDVVTFVGAEQLFLVGLGFQSTLMVRLASIERKDDRRLPMACLYSMVISAAMGLGLATAGVDDPRMLLAGFAGFLLLIAVLIAAPYVSWLSSRAMARDPVIDLRADSQEIVDRMLNVYRTRPDIAREFETQLEAEAGG